MWCIIKSNHSLVYIRLQTVQIRNPVSVFTVRSSHCKHFFHKVSSLNEVMPTTLIPNSINQTADHLCNGFSAWLAHKNLPSPPLHPHPVDKNTCVGQLPSPKNNKKSHALFFDLLLTVTAAASIQPVTRHASSRPDKNRSSCVFGENLQRLLADPCRSVIFITAENSNCKNIKAKLVS